MYSSTSSPDRVWEINRTSPTPETFTTEIVTETKDDELQALYLAVSIPWFMAYLAVYSGIFVTALIGNLLVIVSFHVEPKLRKTTNYFFVSLAHADLLATLLGLPTAIFARLAYGTVTCLAKHRQYFFAMAFMMSSISVGHLVAITIDRFIAISWPLRYRQWVTVQRCKIGLVFIWMLGFMFGILPLFGGLEDPDEWLCGSSDNSGKVVTFHRLIAVIGLPAILLILSCCYVRMYVVARRWARQASLRNQTVRGGNELEEKERKSTMRATVTTVMILGVFAVCWLPSSAKFFIEIYAETTDEVLFLIQTMAEVLSFMNSAINPYLYASRNKDFKRTYEKVLRQLIGKCILRRTSQPRSEHDNRGGSPATSERNNIA